MNVVPAAVLSVLVQARGIKQTNTGLASVHGGLERTGKAGTAMGSRIARGAKVAAAGLAVVLGLGFGAAISKGMEFEKRMDSLGAVMEATAKQSRQLQQQALRQGEATAFSANEVAEAQVELAKGGLKAQQILGGALPAALSLAAAGELELGTAAETTVNAMKLFGLEGGEAGAVADMLATAANRTTADVLDFAMAMKQGGSVTKLAGYDMNESVAILEALAEAGIKNSDAGTSMKAAVIQLLNPSKKQAELQRELNVEFVAQNGHLKSGVGISKELRRATEDMTKAERAKTLATLAGTDGVRTLNALYMQGPKALAALERANAAQGTAQDVAARKMDNLAGDVDQLGGAFETLQINLMGGASPALREITQDMTGLVQQINAIATNPALSEEEKITKVFDLVADAASTAFTGMVQQAAHFGPRFVTAFVSGVVNTWNDMSPLAKLFSVGVLVRALGGKGAIVGAGAAVGRMLGGGVTAGMVEGVVASGGVTAVAQAATARGVLPPTATAGTLAGPETAASMAAGAAAARPFLGPGQGAARRAAADATARALLAAQVEGFTLASVGSPAARTAEAKATASAKQWGKLYSTTLAAETAAGMGSLPGAVTGMWLGTDTVKQRAKIQAASLKSLARQTERQALAAQGGIFSGVAGGIAGQAVGQRFGSGILAKLKSIRWGRIGALGIGLTLADNMLTEFQRRADEKSGDLLTELGAKLKGKELGISGTPLSISIPTTGDGGMFDPHGFFSETREEKSIKNITAQYEEMAKTRVKLSASTIAGLRAQAEELDLTKQARTQLEQMFRVAEQGRDLGVKVDLGMDPAELQKINSGLSTLRSGALTSMKDIASVTRQNMAVISTQMGTKSAEGRDALAQNYRAAVMAIGKAMANGDISIKQGLQRQKELLRNANLLTGDDPLDIAKGFAKSWEKAGGISARQRQNLIADLGKMPPAAREKAFASMMQFGQGLVSGGKIPKQDVRDLKSAVLTQFDDLRSKSTASSLDLAIGVAGNFGSMGAAVANVLKIVQENTNGSLTAFGAKPVEFSVKAVGDFMGFMKSNFGTGQAKQSGGFIVGGNWTGDRPGFWGEAGAFVMNREATTALGFNRGGAVPLALESGERYFSPPEVKAIGAGNLEAMNRAVPRQKGGPIGATVTGPAGPLLDIGRGAADLVSEAAQGYVRRHRPQTTGGLAGYAGPPADMKQLGDAGWVDAHTLAVAAYLERRFGLTESSGYRSPAHNAAVGGVPNSSHTHGSPANPGAIDFTPPSQPALSFSTQHIAGLEEAMIHDVGSGLHLHLAFFGKGGLVQALLSGGSVAAWDQLIGGSTWNNDQLATLAHIAHMSNPGYMAQKAQGESSGDRKAVGHDAGGTEGLGLWQITTGHNDDVIAKYGGRESMFHPYLNAQAAKDILDRQGVGAWYADPTGPRGQVNSKLADQMRAIASGRDADVGTYKEDVPAMWGDLQTGNLHFPSVPKNLPGISRELHRWQDELGDYRRAVRAAKKKDRPKIAQALEHNVTDIEKHLRDLRHERKKVKVGIARGRFTAKLGKALARVTGHETAIEQAQRAYERRSQEAEQIVALEPLQGAIPEKESEKAREARERAYLKTLTDYVEGQERPAYQAVLGAAAGWRNTIIGAERATTSSEVGWEGQLRARRVEIASINHYTEQVEKRLKKWRGERKKGEKMPDRLRDQLETRDRLRDRLPNLRFEAGELGKTLEEARGSFFPGSQWITPGKNFKAPGQEAVPGTGAPINPPRPPLSGTGSFEDALREVQGAHWPDGHEILASIGADRQPGRLGGAIWDTQTAIAELGLRISEAAASVRPAEGPDPAGDPALADTLRELLRQANLRNAVAEAQGAAMAGWNQMRQGLNTSGSAFAGMFATGGFIPPGQWGIAGETGLPEVVAGGRHGATVFSPSESAPLLGGDAGGGGELEVTVIIHGDVNPAPGVDPDKVVEVLANHPEAAKVMRQKVLSGAGAGRPSPGDRSFRP